MLTLGIETSCDETCASVVENAHRVLSNVVATSLDRHASFGGVIPEIASRVHLDSIDRVVAEALKKARAPLKNIDLIAVTEGPGLIGSLLVGISFARALSFGSRKPLLGVNHVRAHLYAAFIEKRILFPFVGLVVSGGHTSLYRVNSLSHEELIGTTRDDACGEAFDKVAKILGLGFPGGPIIEERAKRGRSGAYRFHCPCGFGLDFSFSGIKTAVLYKTRELKKMYRVLSDETIDDICRSFQDAVVDDLVEKAARAVHGSKTKTLVVGGGVSFNNYLRQKLEMRARAKGIRLFMAPKSYCLDNAAMVASLGARLFKAGGRRRTLRLDPMAG